MFEPEFFSSQRLGTFPTETRIPRRAFLRILRCLLREKNLNVFPSDAGDLAIAEHTAKKMLTVWHSSEGYSQMRGLTHLRNNGKDLSPTISNACKRSSRCQGVESWLLNPTAPGSIGIK